ncbi:hypothetical protein E2562_024443 [Oryza meyeriana var. granulata]|uniref:Uncharacterized protein n=1 Tax=Oryza meyeriana var. granulata TaxID=110450 RepID=A0A6G1EYP1_9ORYZ|nr:hypothetical protein E2562_024443 [Oryza meyeriana var. granulata]
MPGSAFDGEGEEGPGSSAPPSSCQSLEATSTRNRERHLMLEDGSGSPCFGTAETACAHLDLAPNGCLHRAAAAPRPSAASAAIRSVAVEEIVHLLREPLEEVAVAIVTERHPRPAMMEYLI